MTNRTTLTASRASRVRRGRVPLVPPPRVASTQEPQLSEEVNGPDRAIGSGPNCDEWTPAETAIATIRVDGRIHDVTVSPNGEHVYVALSDSVWSSTPGTTSWGGFPSADSEKRGDGR